MRSFTASLCGNGSERQSEAASGTASLRRVATGLPDVPLPVGLTAKVVYFVEAVNGLIKIGSTTNLTRRLAGLSSMSPIALRLVGWDYGTKGDEMGLHAKFASARKHGEWFAPTPELVEFIRHLMYRGGSLSLMRPVERRRSA